MTQEEKDLLIKDLCARLPYGVIIDSKEYNEAVYRKHYLQKLISINVLANKLICIDVDDYPDPKIHDWKIELCKPYFRPMSSMTKKEQEEFIKFHCVNLCPIIITDLLSIENEAKMIDWLNAHHFDYRGLIEKGLALEAPEGMYK